MDKNELNELLSVSQETGIMADYIVDMGLSEDFVEYCDEVYSGVVANDFTTYEKMVTFIDANNLGVDYEEYFDDVTGGAF